MSASNSTTVGSIEVRDNGSVTIVQTVTIARETIKDRKLIPTCPYRGLHQFTDLDREKFFGRYLLLQELAALYQKVPLIMLAGASGSGKSSAIRAGLMPALKESLGSEFQWCRMTPGTDPIRELANALEASMKGDYLTVEAGHDHFPATFGSSPDDFAATLSAACPHDRQWLLFVDQFEEIFTRCDEQRRSQFLDGLERLAEQPRPIRVILAMRADFMGHFGPYPKMARLVQRGLCLATDMQRCELREAIEQPAAQHGVVFEDGLVEQIIADFAGKAGALPLMQYTLKLLWEADCPGQDRTLNRATYAQINGAEGALQKHADLLYENSGSAQNELPSERQNAIRRVLLSLVDVSGDGGEGRPVSCRAPLDAYQDPLEQCVIRELVDKNLLITNQEDIKERMFDRASTVEVAHEALFSAWPRLADWIRESRHVLRLRKQLRSDAELWNRTKKDHDLLLGTRLEKLKEHWDNGALNRVERPLSAAEQEFLRASMVLHEEQELRSQRLAEAEAAAREQKLLNEQRELDQYVETGRRFLVEKNDPTAAVLWLHRAYERGSRHPMLPYLLADAMRPVDAIQAVLVGHEGRILSAKFSPGGRRIVTASEDTTARIFDAETGELIVNLTGHNNTVSAAEFSPDGRRVVTASRDGSVRIWDSRDGRHCQILHHGDSPAQCVSSSSDGTKIIAGFDNGCTVVWDAQAGDVLAMLDQPDQSIKGALFSPDGQFIAVSAARSTTESQNCLIIVNIATNTTRTFPLADEPVALDFEPTGHCILVATSAQVLCFLNYQTGILKPQKIPLILPEHHSIVSAEYSADGSKIIVGTSKSSMFLFETKTNDLCFEFRGKGNDNWHAHMSPALRGTVICGRICAWHVRTHSALSDTSDGFKSTSASSRFELSFNNDASMVLSSTSEGLVTIWNAEAHSVLDRAERSQGILCAGFTATDGQVMLVTKYGTIQYWYPASKEVSEYCKLAHSLVCAKLSASAQYLVTSDSADTIRVYDLSVRRVIFRIRGTNRNSGDKTLFTISANGNRLAISVEQGVKLFDISSKREICTIKKYAARKLYWMELSPDGKFLAMPDSDETLCLFNVDERCFMAQVKSVTGVVFFANLRSGIWFCPRSARILTWLWGDKPTIRELESNEPIRVLDVKRGIRGATFSSDGSKLAIVDDSSVLNVFDISSETRGPGDLKVALKSYVPHQFEGRDIEERCELFVWNDRRLLKPLPPVREPPIRWFERRDRFRAGLHAVKHRHLVVARRRFVEARADLTAMQDLLGLSELAFAEAVTRLRPNADARSIARHLRACVAQVMGHAATTKAQFVLLRDLARLAQDDLYTPRVALWLNEQALQLFPDHSEARAALLENRLSVGAFEDVLKDVERTLALQESGSWSRVILSVYGWAAAVLTGDAEGAQSWEGRAMSEWKQQTDGTKAAWKFSGLRYSLNHLEPPPAALRKVQAVLAHLTWNPKNADSTKELTKLLAAKPKRSAKPRQAGGMTPKKVPKRTPNEDAAVGADLPAD